MSAGRTKTTKLKNKMYNVSVNPSKIVAKTRRGINQNIDRLDSHRDPGKKGSEEAEIEKMNVPRPVFHTSHKRSGGSRQQQAMTPEHEELARFMSESWNDVARDYQYHARNNTTGPDTVIYYEERGPNKRLQDFKPFDFEAWWGRRLFNNITKSVP